ncbi:MAG: hypothetical protein JWO05_1054 [Gemmatimonadetes bacterium]|nr:hypothetical protein [Gemmatimonadota bacterium]
MYLVVTVPMARFGLLAIVLGILLSRIGAWWQLRRAVTAFRQAPGSSGRDLLIVYSASPHWQEYIESTWLRKWDKRAVALNRSEPDWQRRPEVKLWKQLARDNERSPVAIVVPLRGRPEIFRFHAAFKDFKHGKRSTLEGMERELESALARSSPGGA